jgi:hypothetical protein
MLRETCGEKAQLQAVSSIVGNRTNDADDEWVNAGTKQKKTDAPADRKKSLLDKIDHAKTSDERDELYVELALYLAEKDDLRARDLVDKIEDSEVRKSARAFIDSDWAVQAIARKNVARALEIARIGDLTHLLRAWVFAQAAKLLEKTDREKALVLIDDSVAEAKRMENSDPERARAFFGAANAMATVNRSGVWDATDNAIRAANSAEKFTGEDDRIAFKLITKKGGGFSGESVPDFDLAGIFKILATEDYERAVELARGFERQAPRANAVIAIARTVLEEKKK